MMRPSCCADGPPQDESSDIVQCHGEALAELEALKKVEQERDEARAAAAEAC